MKISDFGLSREVEVEMTLAGICNPRWRPPEITKGVTNYDGKVSLPFSPPCLLPSFLFLLSLLFLFLLSLPFSSSCGICNPKWRPPEVTKGVTNYDGKVSLFSPLFPPVFSLSHPSLRLPLPFFPFSWHMQSAVAP